MLISTQGSLYSLIVLLAFVAASCKKQPAPTSPSPSAATAATPGTKDAISSASSANASSSVKGQVDACKLLTGDEIKSVQNDMLKDTTASQPGGGDFVTSQCFYTTSNFVNSISLTVTQQRPNAGAQRIREFWKERFGRGESREKEREKERDRVKSAKPSEEEEEGQPPERVTGIGDEAYSVGNAKIGALYILKGDKFLRISIGGSRSQPERIRKMKALAQHVIKRL